MNSAGRVNTNTAFIALGSNLGDRRAMINAAIGALQNHTGIEVVSVSDLIETEPVGPGDQPRYFNAAAELRTTLSPRELLEACLAIEHRLGRDRSTSTRWGPRTIDIDLLLFSDRIINEPGLCVPHPHMHERTFVLRPLSQIAPQFVHPVLGLTIESLLRRADFMPENAGGANRMVLPGY